MNEYVQKKTGGLLERLFLAWTLKAFQSSSMSVLSCRTCPIPDLTGQDIVSIPLLPLPPTPYICPLLNTWYTVFLNRRRQSLHHILDSFCNKSGWSRVQLHRFSLVIE